MTWKIEQYSNIKAIFKNDTCYETVMQCLQSVKWWRAYPNTIIDTSKASMGFWHLFQVQPLNYLVLGSTDFPTMRWTS